MRQEEDGDGERRGDRDTRGHEEKHEGHLAVEVRAQRVDVAVGALAHLTQALGGHLLLHATRLRQFRHVALALPALGEAHAAVTTHNRQDR